MKSVKLILRLLLAAFMIFAGVSHFRHPDPFVKIVPEYLPNPKALVAISGFFEVLGGVGLLVPRVRRPAAWGLIALFLAVFPANVNMAIHKMPLGGISNPLLLWLRLPLQAVLIAWAYWFTRPDPTPKEEM
ncbi:MAG: DoxX family membrane protein [Armatimonadota bacterium]|nr:DoxX family membrane protein [Armatimonadota bacterium]